MAMWSCQRSTYPQSGRLRLRVELVLTVRSKTPWWSNFGRTTKVSHPGWKRKNWGKGKRGDPGPSWASRPLQLSGKPYGGLAIVDRPRGLKEYGCEENRGRLTAVRSQLTGPADPRCVGARVGSNTSRVVGSANTGRGHDHHHRGALHSPRSGRPPCGAGSTGTGHGSPHTGASRLTGGRRRWPLILVIRRVDTQVMGIAPEWGIPNFFIFVR